MVADFYWPFLGGVEQHVRTISHELARRGHAVTVVTTLVGDGVESEYDGAVEVVRIRTGAQRFLRLFDQQRPWAPPVPDPVAARAIGRIVEQRRPDVVHGHDWLARSALLSKRRSTAFVSTQHYYTLTCAKKTLMRGDAPCAGPEPLACLRCSADNYGAVKGTVTLAGNWVGAALERRVVDQQISVSRATEEGNALHFACNSSVVPNCLPPRGSNDHADLLADFPTPAPFLYVGDFRAVKGTNVLLQAYVASGTTRPLVLIGKRWAESPVTFPRGVTTFENWPNSAVRAAMSQARAVIVPSVWAEPFGIVAIEAMDAGAPVVASATGGLAEFIDDETTGLLVPPGSVSDLASALRRLDEDDALCAELAGAGRTAVERFSAERVVDELVAVYETAIAERRAR
jgi:glycosyltransferase involved in cell wall biosynthesis